MHAYTHTHTHVNIHIIHTYIHTCTQSCTHTNTHTCTHTKSRCILTSRANSPNHYGICQKRSTCTPWPWWCHLPRYFQKAARTRHQNQSAWRKNQYWLFFGWSRCVDVRAEVVNGPEVITPPYTWACLVFWWMLLCGRACRSRVTTPSIHAHELA